MQMGVSPTIHEDEVFCDNNSFILLKYRLLIAYNFVM